MKKYLFLFFLLFRSFAYADYVWQEPETLSEGSISPKLAINREGDAISLWMTRTNTGFIAQASIKELGQPWQSPLDIALCKTRHMRRPEDSKITLDSQKNAIAVWSHIDQKGETVLQSSTFLFNSQTWSKPYTLPSSPEEWTSDCYNIEPQLVIDETGTATLAWTRLYHNGLKWIVQLLFATKPLGLNWSEPTFFSQEPQSSSSLIISSSHSLIATWRLHKNQEIILQTASKKPGEEWSAPVDLSIQYTDSWLWRKNVGASEPILAMNTNEECLVAWRTNDSNKEPTIIYVADKDPKQSWSGPIRLSLGLGSGYQVGSPKVAIDHLGNKVVLWVESNNLFDETSDYIVKSVMKKKGSDWPVLNPQSIGLCTDANLKETPSSPELIFDPEGNLLIAWIKSTGDAATIQILDKKMEEDWSAPRDLYTIEGSIRDLQMTMDATGNLLLIWEERSLGGDQSIRSLTGKIKT